MEDSSSPVETLIEKIEAYGKTTYELSKLKTFNRGIIIFTSFSAYSGVVLVAFLFVFILSIGTSILLGELLGKLSYGFFIVAGLYLILAIVFHFYLHKWIKRPLANLIITKLFKKL